MFPDALQLAEMRGDIAQTLVETCILQGVMARVFNTLTGVPCLVDPYRSRERGNADEINSTAQLYILTVAWNQALQIDWQCVHNNNTYDIQSVIEDQSPLIFKRAYMMQVTK